MDNALNEFIFPRYAILNISLKNFFASPSRFSFISMSSDLSFSFFSPSALRFRLPFFRFGSAKVEIFLYFLQTFLKFLFFAFVYSSLSFNPFRPCAFWFFFSLFGVAKVRFFFHFRKKYFKIFSRFFSTLFSIFQAALRCPLFDAPVCFGTAKVRLFYLSRKASMLLF